MESQSVVSPSPHIHTATRKRNNLARSQWLWGYLMIAPFFLGLLGFYIWPIIQTFYFSFTKWEAFNTYSWAGLDNYKRLVQDVSLLHALRNTVTYVVMFVPMSIIISIIVATLLNQKIRGLAIYRTLFFLPVVTMPAAVAMVWKWLYNGDYGLINYVLSLFSIKAQNWLTDPKWALFAIVVVAVWSSIGNNMIIFLSGLQGISSSYYEAASIDGAGPFRKFYVITLPLLTPTIFFVTVISLIGAFQVFDLIYMMIGSRSLMVENTQSVVYLFYKYAFENNDKGYASAVGIFLLVIIMLITAVQMKLQKKWVHYE
ncbi:carbohydrate ABC transporter permease [Paenibacillus aestuarii]|uniref:Sugar ABC transporter permease n=1 Tax=Paenibacillus aestuarii TaxID=516965 RepID=A0ABW0KAM6_9BACL|nr:sugar ABC transporter permease [Paenibacillus aestuarii]